MFDHLIISFLSSAKPTILLCEHMQNAQLDFSDYMDSEEALRYNQYWDDLASGKHLPPGMDADDLARYNLGLQKVDENLALSKIDAEALAKLRAQEAARLNALNNGGVKSPVEIARSSQGTADYPGIDDWKPTQFKAGDILYRGEPKGTDFFTTKDAIESVGASQKELFEGLQVDKHPKFGYRSEMQGYQLNSEIDGAEAKCLANSNYGDGGLDQKFIPNANELIEKGILVPVDKIPLKGLQ